MFRFSKALLLCFLLATGAFLLERCASADKSNQVRLEQRFTIDDEDGLIRSRPAKISCEDDTNFRITIFPQKILNFSASTNRLTVLFDSIRFNLDSLIKKTYQERHTAEYVYLPHTQKEISNYDHNLYILFSYSKYKGKYYIPVAIKTKAELAFGQANGPLQQKLLDSLKDLYGNAKVNSLEDLSFIIVTDNDFNQEKIIPFYGKSMDGVISKVKGGYMYENNYYYSLHSRKITTKSDSLSIEGMEPDYFYQYFTLTDTGVSATKLLIEKKLIASGQYTWSRHLLQKVSYFESPEGLLASMGKELVNLSTNKLYTVQPILEPDEYISNFRLTKEYLTYTTEKYEKQETGSAKYGYINSLSSCNIKMMNISRKKLVIDVPMKTEAIYFFSPGDLLYQYVEDKDSIKINKYSLHPNE